MGDFILHHKSRIPALEFEAAVSCLAAQGSANPVRLSHDSFILHLFPKQISPVENVWQSDEGDFCGSSGTFIYKGMMGRAALSALHNDFEVTSYAPEDFSGIFTVILKKDDHLYLLTDPMGGNRVYQNEGQSLWSSSFLAAATASDYLTPNVQAIYEYAFQETTYAADTVFNEVTCLDALKICEITEAGLVPHDKNLDFDFEPSAMTQSQLIEEASALLRETVKPVAEIFGNHIRTALSGGYDSRLMLALLHDAGTDPHVYVYGPENSPDVKVANNISSGEGFNLDHMDKASQPVPAKDNYPDIVRDNFHALDGLPGEGIFDFGANMMTRRSRADQGHMIFNGGGGEIFRNFFYLPERQFTITDLINSFYNRYTTSYCTNAFQKTGYRAVLHNKIKSALGATSNRLNRGQVEYAYPAFRLRYWTARDNNNNTRLGSYLTPFISYKMIKLALTIPLRFKDHGIFQAELISKISPELASYQSDYGYAFDQSVPAKVRFKNNLTYYRPLCLRRRSYAIQQALKKDFISPRTLDDGYLADIFPDGTPHMTRYFKISQIKDAALLGRVLTLEYLFQSFQEKLLQEKL